METTRQQKISRLIQKELGEIFQREAQNHLRGKLITVTVVRTSPDLSVAKIYLSFFPSNEGPTLVKLLSDNASQYRHLLAQKVKNQLRVIPQLHFFIDDSLDYLENIDRLLK